jgi:hypothetical protein
MALSFTTVTLTLANWGFGAGDIAVLAGVGRSVGTWVMAQHEDRGILSLLDVTPDDILLRKGLIESAALHRRWDNVLTLLQNGKRVKDQTSDRVWCFGREYGQVHLVHDFGCGFVRCYT